MSMKRLMLVGLGVVVITALIAVFALRISRLNIRVGNIRVEPGSGSAGSTVTVIGRGWTPGQEIQISLGPPEDGGEDISVFGVTRSDDAGGFRFSFSFPGEEKWASLPWARVMANVRGADLGVSAPFVLVSATPTRTPGPVVVDALAATYFPLVSAPAEIVNQIPEIQGQVVNLQPINQSSLLTFDLQGTDGQVYHVRLVPELAVMRADLSDASPGSGRSLLGMPGLPGLVQISPMFVGLEPAEGGQVAVVGLVEGANLVAESITVLEGGESRMWYYRSFLDEAELPYGTKLGLGGVYVWVKTTLSSAPALTTEPLEPVLSRYEDQPAIVGGLLENAGGPALTDVTVFIRPSRLYVPIYPEREVDVPR